jgi:hypothetical protein
MIDVSSMQTVTVDPLGQTARVEAGARWVEINRATQPITHVKSPPVPEPDRAGSSCYHDVEETPHTERTPSNVDGVLSVCS